MRRWLFGPITLRDGTVQVWGCSPGSIILSLVASLALTIILNLLIRAF